MPSPQHLILTDLDGTLLDQHSCSWAAAEQALGEISQRHIPLVFVTSKTRAELEVLRAKLDNGHPFITENGGGIFIPQGYFALRLEGARRVGHYHCLEWGRPYAEVTAALREIATQVGASVVGFHQMSVREIGLNTGLPLREAVLARQREFDEPFFFAGASAQAVQEFKREALRRGMDVVRGGRFWHLAWGCDKGRAAQKLIRLYRRAIRDRLHTVGLGDSPNDLPLLSIVDSPVLLPGPDGSFDLEVLCRLPRVIRAIAPGPIGWNQAVLRLLGTRG